MRPRVVRLTVFLLAATVVVPLARAAQWTPGVAAPAGLSGRENHAMAYDATRQRVVLFGGSDGALRNDTWELGGGGWSPGPAAPAGLTARQLHAMAFDAARGRVVIFGGNDGALRSDTWEYDGTTFTAGPAAPAGLTARAGHALAFHAGIARVVLFGGNDGALRDDTWLYDGNAWVAGPSAPGQLAPRELTGMAYDSARGRVVLFGGRAQNGRRRDTWEMDGSQWSAGPNPPNALKARFSHALAYDSVLGRTVLFGGCTNNNCNSRRNDTWEYDGTSWTPQAAAPAQLTRRRGHAMAHDASRLAVVLVGGFDGARRKDVWEYRCVLGITPQSLPAAVQGQPYLQTLVATGGTPPYTFVVASGSLPTGITLSGAGVLAGTPTSSGVFNFTVSVTDVGPCAGAIAYSLVVNPPGCGTLTITPPLLPDGTEGTPYSQLLAGSGGTPPYTFAVASGALPPGLTLSSGGLIAGTPSTQGSYGFVVSIVDDAGCSGVQSFVITVNPPGCGTIVVDPPTLPDGTVGTAYAATLTASGGSAPYDFSLAVGSLPPGLTLLNTGDIIGTPILAGTYAFTVVATDDLGCSGTASYTILVNPPGCSTIDVTPATLPAGTVGTSYSQTLAATGGTAPYTFTLGAGVLPPGITLSSAGLLSGTPTVAGAYSFTVVATDTLGCAGSRAYDLQIDGGCLPLGILPPSLPGATVGVGYSQSLTGTGGTPPYTFALAGGSLPPGITLSAAGLLSGTPTAPGAYAFVVGVTDAAACTGSRPYIVVVNPPGCGTVAINPPALPPGSVGVPYAQTLTGSGGTPPYTFALVTGALPAGLALAPSGLLSGTPTTPGTATFTVSATDGAGCIGIKQYVLAINPPGCGAITIAPPVLPGGVAGQAYNQALSPSGGTPPYTLTLVAGGLPPGLTLSASGLISGTPTSAGSSLFTVAATDSAGCTGIHDYAIDVAAQVDYVSGEGFGLPNVNRVRIHDAAGAPTAFDVLAYGAGRWGVTVAAGDVDGGLFSEVLTAPGPGDVYGPQIRAFRRDGTAVAKVNFYAYGTLKYGANASSDSVDFDAFGEIGTGAGPGDVFGPHVRGWNFDGSLLTTVAKINFFAYTTLRYGVNQAIRGIDGDVFGEILTGPGPGFIFGPQVRAFNYDGAALTAIAKVNFNAFAEVQYGATVAGGDADADGYAEILAGRGPGPALPAEYRGFDYDGTATAAISGLGGTPFTTSYGIRVGSDDLSLDGRWDVVVGPGPNPVALSTVEGYGFDGTGMNLLTSFTAFGTDGYGANVAAGELGY